MKKYSVTYKIYSINVKIISDNNKLLNFIDENYYLFRAKKKLERIDIEINLDKKNIISKKKLISKLNYLGNSIYYNNKTIYWNNDFGLNILLNIYSKNKWKIYCYHFDLDNILPKNKVYENYARIMRFAVHLPVFKFLEIKKKYYLLHGSAILNDHKSNLFLGLNKVGKSTLSKYLVDNLKAKYISDNFIITDGKYVYPFIEKLRLDKKSITFLKINKNKDHFLYNKHHIDISKDSTKDKVKIKNIFIISNSHKFSIDKITNQQAKIIIKNINYLLKEFPEFNYLCLVDFLINKNRSIKVNLQKNINFYSMCIPKDFSLDRSLNYLLKYL